MMQTPPDPDLTSGFDPEIFSLVEPDALMVIDVQPPGIALSTLLRTADGFEPDGQAVRIDGFGPEFDDDLLDLVVARLGMPLPAADDPDPAVRAVVRRLIASVRKARLRLADDESIAIATRLGGATTIVTIDRAEFQDAIRPHVEKLRPKVAQAMTTVSEASSGWVVAVLVRGDAVIAPVLAGVLAADSPIRVFASGIGLLTPSAPWSKVAAPTGAAGRPDARSESDPAADRAARPAARPAVLQRLWDRFAQDRSPERRSLVFALWPVAAAVVALFLVSSAGLLGALDAVPTGTRQSDAAARPSVTPTATAHSDPPTTPRPTPTPSAVPSVAPPPPVPPAAVHVRGKKKAHVAPPPVTPATSSPTPTPDPTDTTDPGTGDPGTGDPGTGDPGTGDPGTGTGDPGAGDPGAGNPGAGDPGGDPGTGDPGTPVDPPPGNPQ